jgi:flagellar basal body P-ring protein FlgI/HPt (histidine-containing phosphotransfer) domain-containing protein
MGAEGGEVRPEAEQLKDDGMSDEIVREFLVESSENLDSLDRELVRLEKDPGNRETMSSIFRTIHTIKGTCGFLGFGKLESVAHAGENLLSLLRDGVIGLTPERTTALLSLVDAVRQMLGSIETVGNEGERNDAELVETLKRLQKDPEGEKEEEAGKSKVRGDEAAGNEERLKTETAGGVEKREEVPGPPKQLGKILVEMGTVTPEDVAYAVQKQLEGDTRNLGDILLERGLVKSQDLQAAVQAQQAAKSVVSESSIRVDVGLLDKLMNLVGELVLARNQILQYTQGVEESGLTASAQRLNLITSELQEGVMKTRMQPIGNIWSKFPRTVRDVATSCSKEVRIEMEGKETELDKTIIEAIKSLAGGTLLLTPLSAPDGKVYAAAQGPLVIGGYSAGAATNAKVVNHPTVGRIPEGALVERDASVDLKQFKLLAVLLRDADFETAEEAALVINNKLGGNLARVVDSRRIEIDDLQAAGGEIPAILAKIGELPVHTKPAARVVVNERTGTVVMGGNVTISACAILHGNLSIQVTTEFNVSQPGPFSKGGKTVVVPETTVQSQESPVQVVQLKEGATVEELIRGLQTMGATARDVVAILQGIKQAGALNADLEVL